jgi:hypothetical protein
MTQDLSALYDYRVSNSVVTVMKPNNYQCATQIVSWHKKGFNGQHITAEKRVNGEWIDNPKAFELAKAQEAKNGSSKPDQEVEIEKVSIKSATNKLSRVAKVVGSADTISHAHIEQLRQAYIDFEDSLRGTEYYDGETSEESEESYA